MELIACPSCGHQGKVPDQLLGKKIKCQICGMSFQATVPVAPQVHSARGDSIEVAGLEVVNWVATAPDVAGHGLGPAPDRAPAVVAASPPEVADTGVRYKVLTQ